MAGGGLGATVQLPNASGKLFPSPLCEGNAKTFLLQSAHAGISALIQSTVLLPAPRWLGIRGGKGSRLVMNEGAVFLLRMRRDLV